MAGQLNTALSKLVNWPKRHAALVLLASCSLFFYGWATMFFIIVAGHFIGLVLIASDQWRRPASRLVTNGVTGFRLAILVFAGWNWSEYNLSTLAILFWLAAILDVVDGWVAKRYNGATEFGAIFDEEVDAIFVLLCSYVIWQLELGPWWIMGAGWIRYVVVLIKANWPPNPERDTHFAWAKTLAGLVFILYPLCIVLPAKASFYLQVLIFSLLLYSFLRELILSYVYPNDLRDLPR